MRASLDSAKHPGEPCEHRMKKALLIVAVCVTSLVCAFGQAEQVKKRAKDLKKNVEAGQTNGAAKTNAPAKK
jgi:hypothetical protein